ncbi:hypothetical protein IJM16_02735 [Candidatus Saccharibacteria bacterium]|nr:hypothetical protein [Candidatus Saccharibacteria bacterium]
MLKQGSTHGDVFKILSDNNIEGMKKSLDYFDFDGVFSILLALPDRQAYARCVLSMASAAACCGKLTNEMALLLLERFGSAMDLFGIAKATVAATNCDEDNSAKVPARLLGAIKENIDTPETLKLVDELTLPEFKALLTDLADPDMFKSVRRGYAEPILRNIYKHNLLSTELLFALMAASVDSPMSNLGRSIALPFLIGI